MKTRKGFVSNSSTTSFTCEITGHTESYWDSVGHREMGFVMCPKEHGFLEEFVLEKEFTLNEKIECLKLEYQNDWYATNYPDINFDTMNEVEVESLMEEWFEDWDITTLECPICQMETISERDMIKYLEKTTSISKNEAFNHVKSLNKRRKKLYDREYIAYVLGKFGTSNENTTEFIKKKYKTYDKFMKFLSGEEK